MNMLLQGQKEVGKEDFKHGRKLLKQFEAKEITYADFEKECTYFALMCGFEELKEYLLLPCPHELSQYSYLEPEQKNKLGKEFWTKPEISYYINEKHRIQTINKTNMGWLISRLFECFNFLFPLSFLSLQ